MCVLVDEGREFVVDYETLCVVYRIVDLSCAGVCYLNSFLRFESSVQSLVGHLLRKESWWVVHELHDSHALSDCCGLTTERTLSHKDDVEIWIDRVHFFDEAFVGHDRVDTGNADPYAKEVWNFGSLNVLEILF